MKKYTEMSPEELKKEYAYVLDEYTRIKAQKLSLDMSRGKPNTEQLNITESLLGILHSSE